MSNRAAPPPRRLATLFAAAFGAAVAVVVWMPEAHGANPDGGVTVQAEVPVTAMQRSVGPGNNSPQVAVHPDDDDMVALANRLDAPDFSCALHVSGDGGQGWVPVDPVPELPEGAEKCYGPEVAFGPQGTLHYLFVGLSGRGNTPMGVFLTSSHDRGQTFSEPTQLLGELSFGVRMAIDPNVGEHGRIHVTWIEADEVSAGAFGPPPNPIMTAHSDDSGQSWSQPVQVSDPSRERVVGPALAVGPGGMVHVAFYDLLDDARDYQGLEGPVWEGTWELVLATSSDAGSSFAPGVVVDGEVTPHERLMVVFTTPPPALAVGDDGRVCVAWTDARHGDGDVLARCASSGDHAWQAAVRVNDDAPDRDRDRTQELPQLATTPSGRIDAIFYDRRLHPQDLHADVFIASSTDGGRTFGPNTRVTSEHSFTQIGARYAIRSAVGMVEFGGRLGLHSTDERAVAAWTDTRNSRPPSRAQDIFAATVTGLPGGPAGRTTAGSVAGIAAGAVGAAALLGLAFRRRRRTRAEPVTATSTEAEPA